MMNEEQSKAVTGIGYRVWSRMTVTYRVPGIGYRVSGTGIGYLVMGIG